MEEINNINSQKKELVKFGITIGIILILIAILLFLNGNTSYSLLFMFGVILILLGITIPKLLKPLYLIWMAFANLLGWIMTRVILTVLFFLILSPIALIARLFRNDFLNLKNNESITSYWNDRNDERRIKEMYEQQF